MTCAAAQPVPDEHDDLARGEIALELAKLNLAADLDGWTEERLDRLEHLLAIQDALDLQPEDFLR